MTQLKQPPLAIARAESPARAVVCAGGVTTSYIRAGRGTPVVLVSSDIDAPGVQEMMESLSRSHVVFAAAPQLADGGTLGRWFHDFAEGLGIGDACLMLHPDSVNEILGV